MLFVASVRRPPAIIIAMRILLLLLLLLLLHCWCSSSLRCNHSCFVLLLLIILCQSLSMLCCSLEFSWVLGVPRLETLISKSQSWIFTIHKSDEYKLSRSNPPRWTCTEPNLKQHYTNISVTTNSGSYQSDDMYN